RDGFGEPDALILLDGRAFWFEVETFVNLRRRSAKQAFRQLFRFHCAARAFSGHPMRDDGSLCYRGATISDLDERKDARLQLRGHQATDLLKSLRHAEHHFVLFSIHKPRGEGHWRARLPQVAAEYFSGWDRITAFSDPAAFPLDRTWYVYWEG